MIGYVLAEDGMRIGLFIAVAAGNHLAVVIAMNVINLNLKRGKKVFGMRIWMK
jgi:hypothetical protein